MAKPNTPQLSTTGSGSPFLNVIHRTDMFDENGQMTSQWILFFQQIQSTLNSQNQQLNALTGLLLSRTGGSTPAPGEDTNPISFLALARTGLTPQPPPVPVVPEDLDAVTFLSLALAAK
jgi:hypothetical protein